MEAIKKTVLNVMEGFATKKAQVGSAPEDLLKKILTKKELGHIKFNNFRKGVISINVDSSSWLYSLSLRQEELLEKLHKHSQAIKEIKLRIGDIK